MCVEGDLPKGSRRPDLRDTAVLLSDGAGTGCLVESGSVGGD